MSAPPPPPPLPPPLPSTVKAAAPITVPTPPQVPSDGPKGTFLVELLVYDGHPFRDHWSYRVCSRTYPNLGVIIHAAGDVVNGFIHEIERSHDIENTDRKPTKRIALQWIDGIHFDEDKMLNHQTPTIDHGPLCGFESSVLKVPAPKKSLNAVLHKADVPQRIKQRNCQTWIIESSSQLRSDGIFKQEVVDYLRAIEQ